MSSVDPNQTIFPSGADGVHMKDSGIRWIGQIPSDWNVRPFNSIGSVQSGYPFDSDQFSLTEGFPLIRIRDITAGYSETFYNGEYPEEYVVNENDFLIAMDGEYSVRWWLSEPGLLNQRCCRVSCPDEYVRKMLYYQMPFTLNVINGLTHSTTVKHLSNGDINKMKVFLPDDLSVCKSIVSYLDSQCDLIDSQIAAVNSLIANLEDLKQSIITTVVLNKCNEKENDQNTGFVNFGSIPSDWMVISLGKLGSLQNGISQSGDYFGSGYPFVNYGDVYNHYSLLEPSGLANSSDKDRELYSVRRGDILFTRTSETIEEIALSSVCLNDIPDAVFSGFLIRFRPMNNELLPEFSKYYFRSNHNRSFFTREMNLVTRASLSQDLLKKLPVVIPPFEVQQKISKYLDLFCHNIDLIIDMYKQKSASLFELRSAIIYEYITGKKQVPQEVSA